MTVDEVRQLSNKQLEIIAYHEAGHAFYFYL
jgi:ATP-dependent Zn protease